MKQLFSRGSRHVLLISGERSCAWIYESARGSTRAQRPLPTNETGRSGQ